MMNDTSPEFKVITAGSKKTPSIPETRKHSEKALPKGRPKTDDACQPEHDLIGITDMNSHHAKNDGRTFMPLPSPPTVIIAGGAGIAYSSSKTTKSLRSNPAPPPEFEIATQNSNPQLSSEEFDDHSSSSSSLSQFSLKSMSETIDELSNHLISTASPETASEKRRTEVIWLVICFLGIMASFVCYGLLLEYTTSGGRELHELSFLFITSALYTLTAAAGRYVRDETPTTIPPARFAVLGLTSMGSTFCSVRSLRYVIYPIQVLAKSCKPVPVMLFGALMGKKYPPKKYFNVVLIVLGVALFMGGGSKSKKHSTDESETTSASGMFGIILLFISLCFDGGTGAYEDKLMSVHSVGPFDLMYNIQLGKTILAGVSLIILNEVHVFLRMCSEMGLLLVALGFSGACGQVFIFVTISKFGALTCSIIGLARKVTTLVASIYFYGHELNQTQFFGLVVCVGSMLMNFMGKSAGKGHGGNSGKESEEDQLEEARDLIDIKDDGNVELPQVKSVMV